MHPKNRIICIPIVHHFIMILNNNAPEGYYGLTLAKIYTS